MAEARLSVSSSDRRRGQWQGYRADPSSRRAASSPRARSGVPLSEVHRAVATACAGGGTEDVGNNVDHFPHSEHVVTADIEAATEGTRNLCRPSPTNKVIRRRASSRIISNPWPPRPTICAGAITATSGPLPSSSCSVAQRPRSHSLLAFGSLPIAVR